MYVQAVENAAQQICIISVFTFIFRLTIIVNILRQMRKRDYWIISVVMTWTGRGEGYIGCWREILETDLKTCFDN